MRISRTGLHDALDRFVQAGHGVVIGNPGSGKTHSLKELATRAQNSGRAHLRLLFDQMGIETAADIERALGIDRDLVALLADDARATIEQPGYLLLDAFDAARSDVGRRQLLHLIRRVIHDTGGKWRVIVSVRTYDAQRSAELLDLFPGGGSNPEFRVSTIKCRHFWIPLLRDDEREEAVASIKGLDMVFATATQGLKELLRIPFNLWLMEKILASDEPGRHLGQIASEVGLLQEFWMARMERGLKADARGAVARMVARAMVDQSSLSVPLERVYDVKADETWQDLLSAEVLEKVGPNRDRIAFRHNMLFDYAVSRLLINDSPEALATFLKEDKARALFLRPSLYYQFASLWQSDLSAFWQAYWRMLFDDAVQVRLFPTLLPPLFAARELRSSDELLPLMSRREKERTRTDQALKRVFQALRVVEDEASQHDAGIDERWVKTVQVLAADCSDDLSYELGTWTERALRRVQREPKGPRSIAYGQIARDLFQWMWARRRSADGARFDGQGSRLMLPLVTQTFGTDSEASKAVLEPVLDLLKDDGFPIDFVYKLADEVVNIWPSDAEFAARIYATVFNHAESSQARTSMGTPVLPMSSTRRQDYGMCYYTLKEHFPKFIRASPVIAARVALQIIENYVLREHIWSYRERGDEPEAELFEFMGGTARYVSDSSRIWNQHLHHEDPIDVAASLFEYIGELAAQDDGDALLTEILALFRDEARVAFTWAQLLLVGSKYPSSLGVKLFDLCRARPFREHTDAIYQLGECIRATYSNFSRDQRMEIEKAILEIPDGEEAEETPFRERRRNRLLGCIPDDLVTTPEADRLRKELKAAAELPTNEPIVEVHSEWKSFSTDDYLADRGADMQKPSNLRLRDMGELFGPFVSEHRNGRPTPDQVSEIAELLSSAWSLLKNPGDADPPAVRFLCDRLTEATAVAARGCEVPNSDGYRLCREILMHCAVHDEPTPDADRDAKYTSAHWWPAPRHEAARGLPWLAVWNDKDPDVVTVLRTLAEDPVPSVRFLAVSEVWRTHKYYTSECLEILMHVARSERNQVVLSALCDSLGRLVGKYERESVDMLQSIQESVRSGGSDTLRKQFVDIVVWLALHRDNTWACEIMESFLAEPPKHARELQHAALEALECLAPKNVLRDDTRPQTDRAKSWLTRAIHAAAESLRRLFAEKPASNPEATEKIAHNLYEVIDQIVTRTYFAAGLFKESKNHPPLNFEDLRRYFEEMRPLLEAVLSVSDAAKGGFLAAPTAHHFMELLNGVLACDPKAVLSMACRVAKASQSGSYQFDSMAVREVVKLVESILADHRGDVRDQESLEHLLDLLDIFVNAGWPEALNMVWRLDEVFR